MVSLMSAGVMVPSSRITKSPKTTSSAFTVFSFPSLLTVQDGEDIFLRASRAFEALASWMVPMVASSKSIAMMTPTSAQSSMSFMPCTLLMMANTASIAAAISKMITSGSLNSPKNMWMMLSFFFSTSLLGPYLASLAVASSSVRPLTGSVPYSLHTVSMECCEGSNVLSAFLVSFPDSLVVR